MCVIVVTVTFLICIYLLRPMFYMYNVTVRNKVVLYCIEPHILLAGHNLTVAFLLPRQYSTCYVKY